MQRYRVLAAPAFNMTGVATKNIHALASGLPLVTTSEGLRGMQLPEGQDVVFVRDNATEFAQVLALALAVGLALALALGLTLTLTLTLGGACCPRTG